jgi:hypothetical protein
MPISQGIKPHGFTMDVALTNSIVNTATALASAKTSDAVNVTVLKKAIDMQEVTTATLLQALPQPQLATSGTLGTQVNTFA